MQMSPETSDVTMGDTDMSFQAEKHPHHTPKKDSFMSECCDYGNDYSILTGRIVLKMVGFALFLTSEVN